MNAKIREIIAYLYGEEQADSVCREIAGLTEKYRGRIAGRAADFLTEKDIFLITYADSLGRKGDKPLAVLAEFCRERLKGLVSMVHILPCFPYSSDDGFSVIDYRQIKPEHGDWDDMAALGCEVELCYDLVINHVSQQSDYFQGFRAGQAEYKDFFIVRDKDTDVSSVLRPRTLPLLHCYESCGGPIWCWTTFSEDQVDWNFANPRVLLEMLDILLFYAEQGGRMIRLDAIAYLWKELGTSCAHLPQTHAVVKLMRLILDEAAPHLLLITETNVPHKENISYFGNGSDEAQVVYNFPLPPLILHTLTAEDSSALTGWAGIVRPVSERTTFLNFTASHDGIGVRPAADILSEEEFANLVAIAEKQGGNVSRKSGPDGEPIPYELNINYFDALNNPNADVDLDTQAQRFLLSQSIALVFVGMPAIYIHSLLGSRNWAEGVEQTGQYRSINREKLDMDEVAQELDTAGTLRQKVMDGYGRMIKVRREQSAFAPGAGQEILEAGSEVFILKRASSATGQVIIAAHNVTSKSSEMVLPVEDGVWKDLLSEKRFDGKGGELRVLLTPWHFAWFVKE